MNESKLHKITVDTVTGIPHLKWAENKCFMVPSNCFGEDSLCISETLADAAKWSEQLKFLNLYTNKSPGSSRLPFSYQKIPPAVRSIIASAIGRVRRYQVKKWAHFPQWPLDLSSDFLADLSGQPNILQDIPTPVAVSHDLDSAEGLTNALTLFADIEAKYGARPTSYIVGAGWPINYGIVNELLSRGHEIGLHGYNHSNTTAFLPPEEQAKRIEQLAAIGKNFKATGYRAPSLLRTQGMLSNLSRHFCYDSTVPTSGGLFPIPNNGCASARPFFIGNLLEIPLSMPRDGSLRFLGHSPEQISRIWIKCANDIADSNGVVVLLNHCEKRFSGNPRMLKAYEKFLENISTNPRFQFKSMQEICDLYKR